MLAGVTFQPSDAFQQVRVPQPSHAQPRGSSWRNRFAASPVSHGLRHLASAGKLPPLRLISSRSRGKAGTMKSLCLAFQTCSSSAPPFKRDTLAGRTISLIDSPGATSGAAEAIPAFDELRCIPLHPTQYGGVSKVQPTLRHHLHQIAEAELVAQVRSEERRVGKECRSRW